MSGMTEIDMRFSECPGCGKRVTGSAEVHYETTVHQDGDEPKVKARVSATIGRVVIEHICETTNRERQEAARVRFSDLFGEFFAPTASKGERQ